MILCRFFKQPANLKQQICCSWHIHDVRRTGYKMTSTGAGIYFQMVWAPEKELCCSWFWCFIVVSNWHENIRKATQDQSGVLSLYPVFNCSQEQMLKEEYKTRKSVIFTSSVHSLVIYISSAQGHLELKILSLCWRTFMHFPSVFLLWLFKLHINFYHLQHPSSTNSLVEPCLG